MVRYLGLLQQRRDHLRLLDAGGADQAGLAAVARLADQLDHGVVLLGGRAIDLVVAVQARDRHVGRDLHHFQLVDLGELVRLGRRRSGHPGQLGVQPEVVLEGDARQRLVLGLDGHVFLGFQRLVQAIGIAPALHHAAGELVDDHHLVVAGDVVHVAGEQHMRAQALRHMVHQGHVVEVVQRAFHQQPGVAQQLLDRAVALLGQVDRTLLLILVEAGGVLDQLLHHLVHGAVQVAAVL